MTTEDWIKILVSVGSGLLGGVIVALINHFFTRRRTNAEAQKLEAEAERIKVETQKLLAEMQKISSSVQEVSYNLSRAKENIIYDGRAGCDGFDFKSYESRFYGDSADKPEGKGVLRLEDGTLNIQRTNTGGRFRIKLLKYTYRDAVKDYLPKNELIAGRRQLKLSCEVKVVGGTHTLVFLCKKRPGGDWLDKHKETFTLTEWTQVNAYFRIPPDKDCELWIDDQEISKATSSVQLRKLILTEIAF